MGGTKEYNTRTGRTVGQAFDNLREELLEENGHDYYAGHQGNNELDTSTIFKSEKDLEKWMQKQEHNGTYYKGTSFAYEIVSPRPNTNKIKTQVNSFPNKGTRKWETVYVGVANGYGGIQDIQIMEIKQADAIGEKTSRGQLKTNRSKTGAEVGWAAASAIPVGGLIVRGARAAKAAGEGIKKLTGATVKKKVAKKAADAAKKTADAAQKKATEDKLQKLKT